jgi:hypothetical protein
MPNRLTPEKRREKSGESLSRKLSVSVTCGRRTLRVLRNGPLVTAGSAPKKPVPNPNVLREWQHSDLSGIAFRTWKRIDEDIGNHDDLPFVGGVV